MNQVNGFRFGDLSYLTSYLFAEGEKVKLLLTVIPKLFCLILGSASSTIRYFAFSCDFLSLSGNRIWKQAPAPVLVVGVTPALCPGH